MTTVKVPPDGFYAFPLHGEIRTPEQSVFITTPGILIQNYLATAAMSALAGNMAEWVKSPDEIATKAYELADAMLRARGVNP